MPGEQLHFLLTIKPLRVFPLAVLLFKKVTAHRAPTPESRPLTYLHPASSNNHSGLVTVHQGINLCPFVPAQHSGAIQAGR